MEGSHLIRCVCKSSSSNFCKNCSGGNSLMVRDRLAMSVDGRGTPIASKMAMFD